jgi:hypothetical protein
MKTLPTLALGLTLVSMFGCGSDDDPSRSSGTGGTSSGGGTGGSSATGGTSGGGAGGAGGSVACGSDVTASALTGGSWDDLFTIPGFTGHDGVAPMVYDFATDTDGTLVATGRFTYFEGQRIEPLMRWKNGAWEPARSNWELTPTGDGFSAVAIAEDGELALATADSFGEKDGEIWLDTGSGLEVVASYTGQVRSLAYYDGLLWVAGAFTLSDGASIENLAVWNGTTWASAPGGAVDGLVYELYTDTSGLYVGGAFANVGGVAAANVAKYDGTTWTAFDFDGALGIFAITRTANGDLYAGGAYGPFEEASGVAKWNGTTWQTLGGGVAQFQTRGVVADLVAHGDTVDVTGCFSTAGGLEGAPSTVTTHAVARWTGTAWQALDDSDKATLAPWFQPLVCGDEGPLAIWDAGYQRLAFDADARLVAGGSFAGIDGTLSQAVVAHDGTNWVSQGTSGSGFGGNIDRIATGGSACDVYGVGTFSHVGGQPAQGRVVRFDGSAWQVLPDSLPSDAWCPGIAMNQAGEVAVACVTFPPAGDAIGVVLKRDGDAMVPMDLEGLGAPLALAYSPSGTLWIAGGGVGGYLARVDTDGVLTIVEDGFDSGVNQLDVVSDTDIVVAGAFTKVGSANASRIAHFDGTTWTTLGDGLPGQVLALTRDGTTTYASSYDEGNGAYLLGAWDGTSWKELATPAAGITPVSEFSFNRIRKVGSALVLGGSAWMDDDSGRGLLVYENGSFRALEGGVGAISVDDIAISDDSIWVAGVIGQAGPEATAVSSVGVARYSMP